MVVEYLLSEDIPAHVHVRQHESFYVLDGELEAWVGEDDFVVGPGDFLFLPSGIPHALTPTGSTSARLLVIATPTALSGGVWPVDGDTGEVAGRRGQWAPPGAFRTGW
jgi:quercetin dioxygenase-like cupin family protein